ncbi:MAG: LysR family transcriptional regulator [Hyphomicrobiaceae bacterium]|nr:LysR family transcriptional regulator [Hyphomicrobiaceae bacterium]MCC0023334.1 LysR family transcriptional regulator [Hyphomicrobiaceae bacterium]
MSKFFDWNQMRAFLATAESGSLSAAARRLGLTQPTLSRQIAALESDLGLTLFERIGRSLSITTAGLDLLEHVRDMGAAADRVALAASGKAQEIEGLVTISASDAMSAFFLPDILREIHETTPGIRFELVSSNQLSDLMRREADIAIRHARPEQPDLIGRLVNEASARFFASARYLERHGTPDLKSEIGHHSFVGFEPLERLIATLAAIGLKLTAEQFVASTNNGVAMRELVLKGLGIGIMPDQFANQKPELSQVLNDLPALPVPVWLVTHRELHTSRRIRIVFDRLAEGLANWR